MSKQPEDTNSDSRVSNVYREIADERAPDHLNKQILRMAAKAGRTRYSAARAWLRPAAWAATIALSFALILDITQLPPATPGYDDLAAPTATAPKERDDEDAARLSEALESADPGGSALQTEKAPLAGQWRAEALPAKVSPAMAPQESEKRTDAGLQRSEGIPSDEMADQPAARQTMNFRARQTSEIAGNLCPPDVRKTPDRWYECIESLRESVPESLLQAELDALIAAFPDFTAPADQ